MTKQKIKITEAQLRQIIRESLENIVGVGEHDDIELTINGTVVGKVKYVPKWDAWYCTINDTTRRFPSREEAAKWGEEILNGKKKDDTSKAAYEEQCKKYEAILQSELEQAKKDVAKAGTTFHYGIRDAMQRMGYTTYGVHDNSCSFFGPSKLFLFYAYQGKSWNAPWNVIDRICIEGANYEWTERYQYGLYRPNAVRNIRVEDFRKVYLDACDDLGDVLKLAPYKSKSEQFDKYKKFLVYQRGGGQYYKVLATFDNFEEAKAKAYEIAKERGEKGRSRRDDTSRYFYDEPRDVTKNHPEDLVTYDYYKYDESSCYIGVEGEE